MWFFFFFFPFSSSIIGGLNFKKILKSFSLGENEINVTCEHQEYGIRHLEMAKASSIHIRFIHNIHRCASPRLFCIVLGHICFHCSSA